LLALSASANSGSWCKFKDTINLYSELSLYSAKSCI
jgi:hypothetical protein